MVVMPPALEKAAKGNIYLREYIDELQKVTNILPKYYENLGEGPRGDQEERHT